MKTHLGERIPLTLNRMKKFLLNLGSAVALPAIFMLWLVPAACAWLDDNLFTGALGWLYDTGATFWQGTGPRRLLVAVLLPAGFFVFVAAFLNWCLSEAEAPLRRRIHAVLDAHDLANPLDH